MMPEQRQQNDDRQGHAEKPKQKSASKAHESYPLFSFNPDWRARM
jgi:hypothetical protein